jgi:putative flavoprotein involved in K+ transport
VDASLDIVVVGAGPAGLCAGAAARHHGWEPTLLERSDRTGGLWTLVPPDMRCLSPRRRDRLPDGTVPQGPGDRATAAEVVAAFDAFAGQARFDVRLGVEATGLAAEDGTLTLQTSDGPLRTRRLVLATGEYGRPWIPALSGTFAGRIEHSSNVDFESLCDGERVLVVGQGNSATDLVPRLLSRGCVVTVSARGKLKRSKRKPPSVLSEPLWRASAIPVRFLPPSMRCGGTLPPVDPVLTDARRRCRIRVVGEVVALEEDGLVAADVGLVACDRVVFCTGFRRELAWTGLALDDEGLPRHREGISTELSNVGFLGLRCLRTRRSQFLRGLWDDAQKVVGSL